MADDILNQATKTVQEAIKADHDGNLTIAFAKYKRALDLFIHVLKTNKNEALKTRLKVKVKEYMDRVEIIQKLMKEAKKPMATAEGKETKGNKFEDALREAIIVEKSELRFSDVGGLDEAKQALKQAVIWPLKFPDMYKDVRPYMGVLFYGPPGTGKSFLAKVLANEAESAFLRVKTQMLTSKWVGEGEKLIGAMFSVARKESPSIIFVDEVESILGSRKEDSNGASGRMMSTFLTETQGVGVDNTGVLFLGATNLPWAIDSAARRRFEKRIYIPLPDRKARETILRNSLKDKKHDLVSRDFEELAEKSEGYSGADISVIVREAELLPMDKLSTAKFFKEMGNGKFQPIYTYPPCPRCPMQLSTEESKAKEKCATCGSIRMTMDDLAYNVLEKTPIEADCFYAALEKIPRSVLQSDIDQFINWNEKFKGETR